MAYAVNALITGTFTLLDQSSPPVGITGATFATKTAILSTNETTTATLTVTELSGGKYRFTFTPTAVGDWDTVVVYNTGGLYRRLEGTYNVVTADQADTGMTQARAAKLDSLDYSVIASGGVIAPSFTGPLYVVPFSGDFHDADSGATYRYQQGAVISIPWAIKLGMPELEGLA